MLLIVTLTIGRMYSCLDIEPRLRFGKTLLSLKLAKLLILPVLVLHLGIR